ncbi:hypothetical protein JMJ35_009548 [Cladonia borealis]|uniref:Uncharacterized protein n=1 Tax=Cladonia borealis TaxID=184061 RepID=A0AA39V1Q7_9LECA|nr:hypothetical protein JMJ35_009548 [Cladonia borealis]
MLFNYTFLGLALAAQSLAAPTVTKLLPRVTHDGVATYYDQDGGTGSCGNAYPDSALIIALSNYWQDDESPGPYCGRKIQITNTGGGQDNNGVGTVVVATVEDTCPSCTETHLDLSQGAFKALTGGNLDPPGQIDISWHFCNADGQC